MSPIIVCARHNTRFARLVQNIQRQAHEPPPHRPLTASPLPRPRVAPSCICRVLLYEKRPPGARKKTTAVEAAKAALRIALHSGLASPSDMRNISECSREACRLCRDGRTFHIKVTANTPLHVWSPPSPPPPLVGASRPWGESGEGAPASPPPRFARPAGAGGLRDSLEAPSLGGRHPGGGRPLVRTGAGIDESATRLSDDGVTKGAKSSAGLARGRNPDPRLGGGARAEKNVAPLRVSHITWDRRAFFFVFSVVLRLNAMRHDAMRFGDARACRCQAMPCNVMPCHAMPCHAVPCHFRRYSAMSREEPMRAMRPRASGRVSPTVFVILARVWRAEDAHMACVSGRGQADVSMVFARVWTADDDVVPCRPNSEHIEPSTKPLPDARDALPASLRAASHAAPCQAMPCSTVRNDARNASSVSGKGFADVSPVWPEEEKHDENGNKNIEKKKTEDTDR